MRYLLPLSAWFLLVGCPSAVLAQEGKPRVLLLGDSIRIGYAPKVIERLQDKAEFFSPKENVADTANALANIDRWLEESKPLIVHLNCGLHDLKLDKKSQKHQVPIEQYEANLRELVKKVHGVTPNLIFATTTPILDARHAQRKASFDRTDADVDKYNRVALKVMAELKVPVNDLNRIVHDGGREEMLVKDGTHYSPTANDRLADAVADCLSRHLYALTMPRRKGPASGPEAVAAYQEAEAKQDAEVPEFFRTIQVPKMPLPKDKADWAELRPEIKEKVVASLGDMPARPKPSKAHLVSVEIRPGYTIERIKLDNGIDGVMSAMMLVPEGLKGKAPAILWLHSSSYYHPQLLTPNTNGGDTPLGEEFIKRGWVVFAPDAAWYGDRDAAGPSGPRETVGTQQTSQHKFHLWFGRTLWGMFVRDDQCALDYLCSRPEVDQSKIGATGISMGSTRAWWLAAVDDRVAAIACVACLTRYENLIRHGSLRAHGLYYFVFGLLKHFDTEAVISLVAPRPALFLTGALDFGSPADGIVIIEEQVGQVYKALDAADRFRNVLYPDVGHTYTPEMRAEVLAWFDKWLK